MRNASRGASDLLLPRLSLGEIFHDRLGRWLEDHGVKVLVDPKSLPYIDGTELDFVREGLNEGFKFHNPREKDRCGCGESFRV